MSDKENKVGIGYRTGATELQDKFEELSSKAERNEKDWIDLRVFMDSIREEIKSDLLNKKEKSAVLFPRLMYFQHIIEMCTMCLLGESIAKIECRLVKLEKSIDNLHLKVK